MCFADKLKRLTDAVDCRRGDIPTEQCLVNRCDLMELINQFNRIDGELRRGTSSGIFKVIKSENDYQLMAARTLKSELPFRERISMLAMGLAGEAGEVVDSLKKYLYHGHKFLPSELKKELGDVLWYVAGIATENDMKIEEIMQANIEKLNNRYPDGFSCERSRNRKY